MRAAPALVAAIVAAALILASPTGAADTTAAALTADPETLTVKLAGSDDALTVTVLFDADQPLDKKSVLFAQPLRLATTDGLQFSDEPINLKPTLNSDRRGVSVPVDLKRAKDLDAGRYEGKVVVRAGPLTGRATLVINAEVTPRKSAEAWTLAVIAITLGALLGALLKWLTETGSKLTALNNRLAQVSVLLQTLEGYVPLGLRQLLLQIRTALGQRDVQAAETALNTLTQEKLMAVVSAGEMLQQLDREIASQRRLIEQRAALSDDERRPLLQVVDTERRELVEAIGPIWPDPAASLGARNALATGIQNFSLFLARYADPSRLGEPAVKTALDAFRAGDWSAAKSAMDKIGAPLAGGAAPTPPAIVEPPLPVEVESLGTLDQIAALLAQHYVLISQALVIIGVLVVGLLLLFEPATTFATDLGQDWLKLFAWGFGAQTTGVTVAQLGGKLVGAGPKFE